ncbi:hypothetical protein AB4Z09_26270 [Rhodococcus sp. TAF43]|uniref:hypothetical protein n=1 Tax=Rhodococcus sp. TAF43 TaxID=3237483 RepID=UPI003F981CEE
MSDPEVVEEDELPVDEWPTQLGRTPIGPPIGVHFSEDANRALIAVAEPWGQRRRSAVVRVAIRRLLANQAGLQAIVEERARNRATQPPCPDLMNMHLDKATANQLTHLARQLETKRGELVRIALDRFLVELAQLRLAGTPFDIETAINRESYNGEENRERMIRRRRLREAKRRATETD